MKFISHRKEVQNAFDLALEQAGKAIGMTACNYAKDECPVDTGNLKNSITHAEDVEKIGNLSVYIGTNVYYGKYQEFGTVTGVKPKHFMQHACCNHSEEYRSILKDALEASQM